MKIKKYLSGKVLLVINMILLILVVYQLNINEKYSTHAYNLSISSYQKALSNLDGLKHKVDEFASDDSIDENEENYLRMKISEINGSLAILLKASYPVNKKSTYIHEIISSLQNVFSFFIYEDINIGQAREISNYLDTIIEDMKKVYPIKLSGDSQIDLTNEIKDKIIKDIEGFQKYLED